MARGPAILRLPEGLNKGVFTAGKLDAGPDNFGPYILDFGSSVCY